MHAAPMASDEWDTAVMNEGEEAREPTLALRDEFVEALENALHKRIVRAWRGGDAASDMGHELSDILGEIASREDHAD